MIRLGRLRIIKNPRVYIPLLVVAVVVATGILAARNLNAPAEGTITNAGSEQSVTHDITQPEKTYSGKYIGFRYPALYEEIPAAKSTGYLDSVKLVISRGHNKYASIGLLKENISNDSGVNYRKLHPEIYSLLKDTPSYVLFSKKDGTEYTGFIAHGDSVLTVSFTSVATAELKSDYETIIRSLEWRQ